MSWRVVLFCAFSCSNALGYGFNQQMGQMPMVDDDMGQLPMGQMAEDFDQQPLRSDLEMSGGAEQQGMFEMGQAPERQILVGNREADRLHNAENFMGHQPVGQEQEPSNRIQMAEEPAYDFSNVGLEPMVGNYADSPRGNRQQVYKKTSYSNGKDKSGYRAIKQGLLSKSSSKYSKASLSSGGYSGSNRPIKYTGYGHHLAEGGCSELLLAPMNSHLKCFDQNTCSASCMQSYTFPSGVSELTIVCHEGRWMVQGSFDSSIPPCSPVCLPGCENGGSCSSPNVCTCVGNFYGPYCQYERKPCLEYPTLSNNARRSCTDRECMIRCMDGYIFPDGSTSTELHCKDGEWVPLRRDWVNIPECQPVCSPPCQNGGVCLGSNVCQCPQEFRGDHCQFSTSTCDVRKLGFNGNYKCQSNSDMETIECTLKCPGGMKFADMSSGVSSSLHVCSYSTGKFVPAAPRCIFDESGDLLLNYIFSDSDFNNSGSFHHSYHYSYGLKNTKGSRGGGQNRTALYGSSLRTEWICHTWNFAHFRTFNGDIKSIKTEGDCEKTMMEGNIHHQFLKIQAPERRVCKNGDGWCFYFLVQIGDTRYNFSSNSQEKLKIFDGRKWYTAPQKFGSGKVEIGPQSMMFSAEKLNINWNLKDTLRISIDKDSLENSYGVCGTVQEKSLVKVAEFNKDFGNNCAVNNDSPCLIRETERRAEAFCYKMISETSFSACKKAIHPAGFIETCKWDYCSCENGGPKEHDCGCESIETYVNECKDHDVEVLNWRSPGLCMMKCGGGKIYKECGFEETCGNAAAVESKTCEEGCFCPEKTYLLNGTCLSKEHCPCRLRGRDFPPGHKIPKDCNTCTCSNAHWVCTKLECSARCEAVGDPHYITFDKKSFEFMGQCSYVLVETDNYTIEAENTPCDGAISESLGYSRRYSAEPPTCTKAVTINIGDHVIKLKQGKQVSINGMDHTLPLTLSSIHVRRASSIFVQVDFFDGLDVLWDGSTRIYIHAPPSLKQKTKGLCGTFNGYQSDDFLTPENDVEEDPTVFGNKWKTKDSCLSANSTRRGLDDCAPDIRNLAENICNKIVEMDLFKGCELGDKADVYRDFCKYDVCSCSHKLPDCYCPIFSSFADRCSKAGYPIDWRSQIRECGIRCMGGTVYEICGSTCTRSCADISRGRKCFESCVEGCYCPPGQTMDHHERCIPIGDCPCIKEGLDYPAGHKELRRDAKGTQLCTCTNAIWECHTASPHESALYANSTKSVKVCSASNNQEYTHCEPTIPITCQNMHKNLWEQTERICYGGCVCKRGFVLDSEGSTCVRPDECPCHHGGRSYSDGQVIQELCNTCKCKSGKWNCTDHICPGSCTTWGDSHFQTFDGKIYDFQGSCEYVLSKGASTPAPRDSFSVIIELVPCGSTGISCAKSVSIHVGQGESKESLTLDRRHRTSKHDRIVRREAHLFAFAEVPDLGIVVQWDRGTRISVRLDPRWRGKVKGLCGNYNNDFTDDFTSPSGGLEPSVEFFGDSWKIYDYCPLAPQIKETCNMNSKRREWSVEKCSVLKSHIFSECHSELQVDPYMERCIFDACGCDEGGDCDCLCTSIAAYAQECNAHGVHIKWRSQYLCPLQCDEKCSEYSPCVSTCPLETCDNLLATRETSNTLCKQDTCVEGCLVKQCPEGQVYKNSSSYECVSKAECRPMCLTINETDYYEGDLVDSDDCHRCYCSRNRVTCSGEPCRVTKQQPLMNEQSITCVSGWSEWINSNKHNPNSVDNEVEPLPSIRDFRQPAFGTLSGQCAVDQMTSINCRTTDTHLTNKETGEEAECSLERGLFCSGSCSDYEIRVNCECDPSVSTSATTTVSTTTPTPSTTALNTEPASQGVYISEEQIALDEQNRNNISEEGCGDGEVWDACAYDCEQLCHHARLTTFRLKCTFGVKCIAGCRPLAKCPPGKRWRDHRTCVSVDDCTCSAGDGLASGVVKPGEVTSPDCRVCQCLKNELVCDESHCRTSETPPTVVATLTTNQDIIIIHSTVSSPPQCSTDRYIPLLLDVPDSGLSASSSSTGHFPYNARMTSGSSWRPNNSTSLGQWLQVDLGSSRVVYGITVKGDATQLAKIRTFHVLFSTNGISFSFIGLPSKPKIFLGPVDSDVAATRMFSEPIETRYIRVIPESWSQYPALRIELLGCDYFNPTPTASTTFSPTESFMETTLLETTTNKEVCTDKMSVFMDDRQIKASSSSRPLTQELVSVYGNGGWSPLIQNKNQWLEFDFLGPRILTGLMFAGKGPSLDVDQSSWVKTYTITYSHNGKEWNPVVDKQGKTKSFKGNKDSTTIKTMMFWEPINAAYIRIIPISWHNNIALRAQILGCYKPYPSLPPTSTTQMPTTLAECNLCPGASLVEKVCPCKPSEWWAGDHCTTRAKCPCFVGFISYAIGTVFDNEECEQCTCTLSGVPFCEPKKCPPCGQGLKHITNNMCQCGCEQCLDGERLCPTSNICIKESAWCDGVVDCPDDELGCTTTQPATVSPTTSTTLSPVTGCPSVKCPPGYTVNETAAVEILPTEEPPSWSPFGKKSKWGNTFRSKGGYVGYGAKGHYKGRSKHRVSGKGSPKTTTSSNPQVVCPQFQCLPTTEQHTGLCERPTCQDGYDLEVVKNQDDEKCPQYSCVKRKLTLPNGECVMTGRTFTTFDGTEYKYDICDHILARKDDGSWSVKKLKNCYGLPGGPCLLITHNGDRFLFKRDLDAWLNDYHYTIPQLQSIGAQRLEFSVRQASDTYMIFTSILDFSVIWDTSGNVKIIVPGAARGHMSGLCGYFDGDGDNDRRKPNQEMAMSSSEFGDSWGNNTECETIACPLHTQRDAYKICQTFKEEPLNQCETKLRLDKLVSQCVEAVCACIEGGNTTEQCKCEAILEGTTECQTLLPEADLTMWRVKNDCPVTCPPGLVYRTCFTKMCEPCCAELMLEEACPITDRCFPGCYCPDGLVRNYDKCVRPTACRDCQCDGIGSTRYVTFDRADYSFNSMCTHTLAQTIEGVDVPQFKIWTTHKMCPQNPEKACLQAITLLYNNHIIQVIHDGSEKLDVHLNQTLFENSDLYDWIEISESEGKSKTVSLPWIYLDLEVFYHGKGFSLKLPSQMYRGKTEGLCGSCNVNTTDDFKTKEGIYTENLLEFAESWLVEGQTDTIGEEVECMPVKEQSCPPPEEGQIDHCQILASATYSKCHPIVDPATHIAMCHEHLCTNVSLCTFLEAYARQCQNEGVCLDWRGTLCPYNCPPGLEYSPCGLGCTETCDNYELFQNSPEKCSASRGDTCSCPQEKVFHDGNCIEKELCKPCDAEGHYAGDVWKPDLCTECSCEKSSIHCRRITCPEIATICARGFKSIMIKSNVSECCPKHICVPEPTPGTVCPEPQQPKCGFGQILKMEMNSAGCQEFICQCLQKEDCPDTTEELRAERPPGMVTKLDESGCCPVVTAECQISTCPKPAACPEHHELIKTGTEACCPLYHCAIPEGKCLYEMAYISRGEGGERQRTLLERETILKLDGDIWNDGPCRECKCDKKGGSSCTFNTCQLPPESDNYVLTPSYVNQKCCPIYKRTACKVGDIIYSVGQVWPTQNPCINTTCVLGIDGELTKLELSETCQKDCTEGWKYQVPADDRCCGECKVVGCVVAGKLHNEGSIWFSQDNCTAFECVIDNNQAQVISSQEKCPDISNCPTNRVYQERCCQKCNTTIAESHSSCLPASVEESKTVGVVSMELVPHGKCMNKAGIIGFTECSGSCDSYTKYNTSSGDHDSTCSCCKPNSFDQLLVPMVCEDGIATEKYISVPNSCSCTPCDQSTQPSELDIRSA